ncbi:MAG: N-acetylmuramoyl-L-alanine amidase [Bacteroidales bacterium]|nr:N-acetylmuramoyl-L-alanine amidase [Bacteroidales bacterium]
MTHKIRIIYFIIMVCAAASSVFTVSAQSKNHNLGLRTIVIDPGHGGKDPGAPGQTAATSEKHIVLAVSKLFGEKIKEAYPDVKVVYTRSNDTFLGLHDRAMVARKNNADLFVSIHCNSVSSKSAFGSSVHILGQKSDRKSNTTDYFERNMSVAQRENEVIVLEEGYETKYTHFDPNTPEAYIGYALQWQAHYESSLLFAAEVVDKLMVKPLTPRKIVIDQDIFQVLVEANMPAVLLELAFISNPTEYKYLASAEGQKEIADRLFEAFKAYKTQYDSSLNVSSAPVQVEKPAAPAVENPSVKPEVKPEATDLKEYYSVQIMSLGKLLSNGDPALKGVAIHPIKPEGSKVYKYVSGKFAEKAEALKHLSEVRKAFPEAFLVKVNGTSVVIP